MGAEARTKSDGRSGWALAALALLAAAARIFWALRDRVVWGDEPFYLWLGRNWLTGRGYSFTGHPDVHHTPGYPFLSGLLYLVTGNMDIASRILYVLLGAMLIVPIYVIARRVYGTRTAIVAGLLVATHAALTAAIPRWGTMTEPPYFLFVYSALCAALVAMEEDRRLAWGLTGVFIGMAYLTRPEAIGYLVLFGGYLALVRLLQKRLLTRKTIYGFLLLALGFVLFFAPYAVYARIETGEWMVSEKAGVTFITCVPLVFGDVAGFDKLTWGLDSTGKEVWFFSHESYNVSMMDWIRANPREFARLVYRNLQRFANFTLSNLMFPAFLVPFIALAWFQSPWSRRRLAQEGLLVISMGTAFGFVLFLVLDRYIAVILPLLLIWTARGLELFSQWLTETAENLFGSLRRWRMVLWIAPVLVVMAFNLWMMPRAWAQIGQGSYRPAHKAIGLWLKGVVDREAIIMSRYPAIAFHADTRWAATPNASYTEVLAYARHKGARYWVIDEVETQKLRKSYEFLVTGNQAPSELKLIHLIESEKLKLMVYEILDR